MILTLLKKKCQGREKVIITPLENTTGPTVSQGIIRLQTPCKLTLESGGLNEPDHRRLHGDKLKQTQSGFKVWGYLKVDKTNILVIKVNN